MAYDVLFYDLLLVGLLWWCLTWYGMWSRSQAAADQTTPNPINPTQKRSRDLKPFPGLTHKPRCAACELAEEHVPPPPPVPPLLMAPPYGRPRAGDPSLQFCPNARCRYYGWVGRGHIRANGHPGGNPWRQFQCVACHPYFLETQGTLFYTAREYRPNSLCGLWLP
jgi:hypothetical protein